MALQTSGAISLANIQSEFGASNPISINEYYRGGANVPNSSANSSIPTSGTISLSNFYGGVSASADNTFNFTMSIGTAGGKYAFNIIGANDGVSYLNNISNGAVTTNNLAVSETIVAFAITQGLGWSAGASMSTSASGGADRLWNQGAVRGFNLNGTNYSFVAPTSGATSLSMAQGTIGSTPPIETQMTNLIGSACTVTLTY
mgnify:CR=1 FL=1